MRSNAKVSKTIEPSLRLEDQVCFALYSTALAMGKLYRKALAPLALTYPQYLVMMVLWERDGINVTQLGEQLFLDSATLTPLLKRMEQAGLLTRARSATDERQVCIALTDTGRSLRMQAQAIPEQVLCAAKCSPAELVGLRKRINVLRSNLLSDS